MRVPVDDTARARDPQDPGGDPRTGAGEAKENSTSPGNSAAGPRAGADPEELWEDIGFHKPMAGFWYNLVLNLVELLLGVVLSGILLNYFYPFPESKGYVAVTTGLFAFLFQIFDLGTNGLMDRFIADARIKDPQRMLHYVQWFIWYQMITGLVQVTAVAGYTLYVLLPQSALSYGVWLMLIYSCRQYPGFLGVFTGTLNSLQHYHRSAIVGFLQGEVFQRLTEAAFVFAGRFYGVMHPEVGEIMGIAIGAIIGTYADDFLGTAVAARFFSRAMRAEGVRARDCFKPHFTWAEVKEPLKFAIKTGAPGLLGGFAGFYLLTLHVQYFPQYTTYAALVGSIGSLMWIMGEADPPMTALYAEAYQNGKEKLTEYYLGQAWRYAGLILGFFVTVFLVISLFLEEAFRAMGILYYIPAIPFIVPTLLQRVLTTFQGQAGKLITAAHRPNYILVTSLVGTGLNMAIMTWIVAAWQPQTTGRAGMIFVLVFAGQIAGILMTGVAYAYVQKTIVRVRIPWWQTFVAPGAAASICYLVAFLAKIGIYDPLRALAGFYVALLPMVVLLLALGLFVYFPLTAAFGGWDAETVAQFEKVVRMAGPSKGLVRPMWRAVKRYGLRSPLHDRFGMDARAATREAHELLQRKRDNRSKGRGEV